MLLSCSKRLIRALHSQNSTATSFVGSYLPAKHAAQALLKVAATLCAVSQQVSPWLVVRFPVLLKRFITRLAVVLLVTLCPALVAQAQVNVVTDLISFARSKSENSAQSLQPLYTLVSAGNLTCVNFEVGKQTKSLTFTDNSLQTSQCQLGEGLGSGNLSDWDSTIILTWANADSCIRNTGLVSALFFSSSRRALY